MEKIKRFFECLVPVTACNLKCSYCYVIQRDNRKLEIPKLQYSVKEIGYALRKERMGGVCFFSICGAGETLLADQIVELVQEILRQGHYVNITTNGTITHQFDRLAQFDKELLQRLHISFSFHYLELKRINFIDRFFENINHMKMVGCSVLVQLNMCDEYEPFLNDIFEMCVNNVGAPPQVAPTRAEIDLNNNIRLFTGHTYEEYLDMARKFESPLFDFNMKNFNIKRKEFCYAGDWSGVLNLNTGILHKCYFYGKEGIHLYENPESNIHFCAVGRCGSPYCMNSSHFLTMGVIPELYSDYTYSGLRNRETAHWYNDLMQQVLNYKLSECNKEYSSVKKLFVSCKTGIYIKLKRLKHLLK